MSINFVIVAEGTKINFVDEIPDDKPHCGNCDYWNRVNNLIGYCDKKNEDTPFFSACEKHKQQFTKGA